MQKSKPAKEKTNRDSKNSAESQKSNKPTTFAMPQTRVGAAQQTKIATTTSTQLNADTITAESIARCAYFLWEQDGHQVAREKEYWLKAENILRKQAMQN